MLITARDLICIELFKKIAKEIYLWYKEIDCYTANKIYDFHLITIENVRQ